MGTLGHIWYGGGSNVKILWLRILDDTYWISQGTNSELTEVIPGTDAEGIQAIKAIGSGDNRWICSGRLEDSDDNIGLYFYTPSETIAIDTSFKVTQEYSTYHGWGSMGYISIVNGTRSTDGSASVYLFTPDGIELAGTMDVNTTLGADVLKGWITRNGPFLGNRFISRPGRGVDQFVGINPDGTIAAFYGSHETSSGNTGDVIVRTSGITDGFDLGLTDDTGGVLRSHDIVGNYLYLGPLRLDVQDFNDGLLGPAIYDYQMTRYSIVDTDEDVITLDYQAYMPGPGYLYVWASFYP